MGIIVGFLPFLAFATLSGRLGPTGALAAGAIVSAAIGVRGQLAGASPKILEIGTFVLFAALAVYTAAFRHTPSVIGVRLCVDCGLLTVILLSLAIRSPFTLQYAREQVPREDWNRPTLIRVNYVISTAWALAFTVMAIAEAALLYVPGLPQSVGYVTIVAALLGGVAFTRYYSQRARTSFGAR